MIHLWSGVFENKDNRLVKVMFLWSRDYWIKYSICFVLIVVPFYYEGKHCLVSLQTFYLCPFECVCGSLLDCNCVKGAVANVDSAP